MPSAAFGALWTPGDFEPLLNQPLFKQLASAPPHAHARSQPLPVPAHDVPRALVPPLFARTHSPPLKVTKQG